MTIQAFVAEEHRESFIEIYEDDPERRLVTCIEVLSPSNKRKKSKGRKLYLRKRQSLLLGSANLVEIDLLRGGERMPMLGKWPDSPYTLLVCREHLAPTCTVWPAHFRQPLPTLPIPLSHPDPDVRIELQPFIAAIYARSRYHLDIDYSKPLDPPLAEADAAWLADAALGKVTAQPTRLGKRVVASFCLGTFSGHNRVASKHIGARPLNSTSVVCWIGLGDSRIVEALSWCCSPS